MDRGEPDGGEPLPADFFSRDALAVAEDLIECGLYLNGCGGEIVETEAYRAVGDPACHTFFREKARTFVASHPPGSLYVYLNYGVHWLLNFLTRDESGNEGFVLVRALRPTTGQRRMVRRRQITPDAPIKLCSGPGKLTQALAINGAFHGRPPSALDLRRRTQAEKVSILRDRRIGISRAQDFPWRFLSEKSRKWVSKPIPPLGLKP